MKLVLVHYAYPPVIGGVEFVMQQHARLFARNGYSVRIVCGEGESRDAGIHVVEIPELLPGDPKNAASQAELENGAAGEQFDELKAFFRTRLGEVLDGADVVFVHNMMTMHFNLAATAALAELAEKHGDRTRFVNWIHDLAAINPDYALGDKLDNAPWNLLNRRLPGFQNVLISDNRQAEFMDLTGSTAADSPVIPNGVEYLRLLKLTQPVRRLIRRHGILYKDIVLFHPTRILRRKNVELGIRVLAGLKNLGYSAFYLVSGAPDPHNPATREYGAELKALIAELGVERDFLFVSETFKVSDDDLVGLYSVSDGLFLPSKQEGFGLPLLEAGLFRLPVFCPRREPMQSILKHNVTLFGYDEDPEAIAERVAQTLISRPGYHARKEVMNRYSWEKLFTDRIRPLCLA